METITIVSIVAAIMGIVQVLKVSGLPTRFAPLTSLVIGIAFLIYFNHGFDSQALFDGIVAGLMACGLWAGTKTTLSPTIE